MMDAVGYVAMLVVGLSLGLIGGGGSILTVPILVYLFGETPVVATGYSLFVVGVASVVGAWRYHVQKLIDYRIAAVFAVPSLIGAFVARRFIVPAIPVEIWTAASGWMLTRDIVIMAVFGIVMVLASVSMIRRGKVRADEASDAPRRWGLIALEGVAVGTLTGFVGAGGGFLVIPALVVLAGVPMKTAIGTSLLIIAAKSLVGFAGDLAAGAVVDWLTLATLTGLAIAGIFLGSAVSRKVRAESLKTGFGWFVLAMGTFILGRQIAG